MLGSVVFLFHLGDLLEKVFVLRFQVRLHALQLHAFGNQFGDDFIGLGTLVVQFRLGGVQFLFGGLQIRLFRFQFRLGLGHGLGGFIQLLQAAVIGSGDLLDHAHTVQKIREAVGLKQDLPIAKSPFFLHGADTDPVFLVQLIVMCLGIVQFILLICDQHAEG